MSLTGFPMAWDWCLLGDTDEENERVVAELNAVLARVIERAKRENLAPWDLVDVLYPDIDTLDMKYPGIGILDTEGRETMAIFFAENYREDVRGYVMWRKNQPF